MIKGLYAAASAMLAGINRQQAIAHDVANLDTPGFKQVLSSLDDFKSTQIMRSNPNSLSDPVTFLGMLGLGVDSSKDSTDFSQGGLKQTGNEFDLAINGNGFFRIKTPAGERYSRDGRFIKDAQGSLTTVDGNLVLNASGQPIKLTDGEASIAPDGTITINGTAAGQIGIASFLDPAAQLTRDGDNTFASTGAPNGTEKGSVAQGYLEMSNANPTQLMTQLVEVSRSYEAAQQMVQNQDELLGKTIASLGRIG
jgi:flagellar basal-body rod protein FlgF